MVTYRRRGQQQKNWGSSRVHPSSKNLGYACE